MKLSKHGTWYEMLSMGVLSCFLLMAAMISGCGGPTTECKIDSDCKAGEVCKDSKCQAKTEDCKEDKDCAAGQECKNGKCQTIVTECKADTECPMGQVCKNGKCEPKPADCKADSDCKTGEVCNNGKCEPKPADCKADSDCKTGEVCKNGKCEPKPADCKADSDCKTGEVCNNGKCEPKPADCKADSDCKTGEVCKNGKCEPKPADCKADSDCKTGEVCKNGKCEKKPGWCTTDAECQSDEECKNNSCVKKTVTGCKTDSDCKAPTAKCKVSTGKCVECLSDGDCSGGKKCENEVCKDVGTGCQNCGVDEFCFENEKCIPKFKSCQAATDCKTNETCVGITQTSAICLINCDTRKNTSKDNLLNPECYGGYGECLGVSQTDPNKGACVPPRKAKRGWKESCGDFLNPDKPSYHNCKDSDTMCVNTGEAAFCWKKCDPAKNDANKKNPGCEAGQGVCHALQSGGGVCEPVRPKTQNKGDKCLTGDPSDPTWADCKEGLMCKSGVCADAPKKTRKLSESCLLSNPADPGYDDCIDGLICSANKCVDKCDINKATPATNPDCPPGFFCSGTGANTMCKALPEKKTSGTKQLGEDCSNVTAANFCDPSKDLFCNFPKCAKACDPRQGTTTNPSCTANEECVEITTYSHLGGGCLPKPSQQKGAVCNTTDKRCIAGLTCYWDHCGQTCDAAKPQPSDCASDEWCITAGKVCAKKCDPANGTSTNTACGQGTYCAAHSTTYKPGHCRPLPSKKQGPKQLGEDCSNYTTTSFCDGSKNYFCNFPKCAKSCDPRLGKASNPLCSATEECVEEIMYSFLGGICLANPTQKEDEFCDNITKRCITGFVCAILNASAGTGLCKQTCTVGQPGCPSGTECKAISSGSTQGACVKLRTQTRQKDEDCLTADDKAPSYHDCVSNFLCLDYDDDVQFCTQKCNPSQATCPSGYKCYAIDYFDPTAGACILEATRTRQSGESCEGNDPRKPDWNDCITGYGCSQNKCIARNQDQGKPCDAQKALLCKESLTCVGTQTHGYHCLDTCDPKAPQCPTGYKCIALSSGGACAQTCKTKADCSYGSVCEDPGIGDQLCL